MRQPDRSYRLLALGPQWAARTHTAHLQQQATTRSLGQKYKKAFSEFISLTSPLFLQETRSNYNTCPKILLNKIFITRLFSKSVHTTCTKSAASRNYPAPGKFPACVHGPARVCPTRPAALLPAVGNPSTHSLQRSRHTDIPHHSHL